MMNIRIGQGYDVHQLTEGRELWIGGIQIPHTHGSLGHSDGDVLIHAICDAMLGALCLQDIGFHFPDTASQYKGIDSKILLAQTVAMIKEKGYCVSNIDSTVSLERPKLRGYIDKMREILAEVLEIEKYQISVKATTTEKLGFVGKKEGLEARAIVLLNKL